MSAKKQKEFDTIAMKRRIQEEIYEETKDMSPEEFIAYVRQQIADSRFADFLSEANIPDKTLLTKLTNHKS